MFFVMMILWFLLFSPSEAYAWGPGTHVEMAMRILADATFVVPFIARLIQQFPEDFIYGVTSPDIIVGKKYAGYHHHCHNWRMGKLILSEAQTDRQRAASYGYLVHLAMDVVAHNYYVPFKIVRSYPTRLLSHTYWEMRFDLKVPDEAWAQLAKIPVHSIDEFDQLLERVLRKTLFSFSTNKRIFNTILIIQKMRSTRETLKLYAMQSQWELEEENRQRYLDLTWNSVRGFLSDPEHAPCLQVDPAGLKRLAYAKNLRHRIRGMLDRGILTTEQAETLVGLCRERLEKQLFAPEEPLPDVIDVL